MADIKVPDGYRLFVKAGPVAPGVPRHGVSVILLPVGVRSVAEAMAGLPKVHAAITHDRGSVWPDNFGCQMVQAALDDGGTAVLHFHNKSDAKRCRALLSEVGR